VCVHGEKEQSAAIPATIPAASRPTRATGG